MKLAITADSTVTLVPTVDRFFHEVDTTVAGDGTLTVTVEQFWDDTGAAAVTLPELIADNSYFNVYSNGVLQMADLLSYTPGGNGVGQLVVTVPADSTIEAGTPVVLEITNYEPATDTTIVT